jgi:hypothetical protein
MISKDFRLIIVFALLLSAFGWSSDDDANAGSTTNELDLLGTWDITTLVSELPLDLNGDDTISENLHTETDCIIEQLIFNEDGTWSGDSEFALAFITELQGVLCFNNSRGGNWSLSGNMLTLTASGIDRDFNIVLTSNVLSFNLLGGLGFDTTVVIGSYQKQ